MAIVNVTPDSFSDGGVRFDPQQAINDAVRFVSEGADFIDIGGESTRPGSQAVTETEELARVLPVVKEVARQGAVVSIDTRRVQVARACLDAGAKIINDVSALRDDPDMLALVAERNAPVVLMHRRGQADTRYEGPPYHDVLAEVGAFLRERAAVCEAAGVDRMHIVLDPGVGFGKTPEENLALVGGATAIGKGNYPILIGTSRKGFIGRLTGVREPAARDPASIWLAVEAVRRGAAIIRVHDVAGTRQALAISSAMR